LNKYLEKGDAKVICIKAGVSHNTVQNWMTYGRNPRADILKYFLIALAEYKKLDYKELLIECYEML
jgi:hypothetical protein